MQISKECIATPEAEMLRTEWYYSRKLLEAKTEDEAKAYTLFWHCSNELIKDKYKNHERSLSHGTKTGTKQNL